MSEISLRIGALREAYIEEHLTPGKVIEEIYRRIAAIGDDNPIWISQNPEAQAIQQARALKREELESKPLWGIPFAVKDNIDVAGLPTTAGCPAYAYTPTASATTVQRLLDAGAILIGKTNMDQFATGLVGTRSPYGACHSVFSKHHISGGSSSGSGVAVAGGLVSFSLGTDTAGSGRVPAAFNNIIGLKPTRGALSNTGVVPACRSLDCISIFALDAMDADTVLEAAQGLDPIDPYSRPMKPRGLPWGPQGNAIRVGIPHAAQLEFFGDEGAQRLFAKLAEHLKSIGCEIVGIDWTPFKDAANLLYSGPWVAERFAAVGKFLEQHPTASDPTVRKIITGANGLSAIQAFEGEYRLKELCQQADIVWREIDVLLLPTTGTTYRIDQVNSHPIALNTNLGYYTNFVNLMDLTAVAVPAGLRSNELPFGATLISRAFTDHALFGLSHELHRVQELPLGNLEESTKQLSPWPLPNAGTVEVAVVGAHLSGQPLNSQLTERGARLARTCRTAADYRLYALANTTPAKPGLIREPGFEGPGLEVEIWTMPSEHFGSFVALIPTPLGIGKLTLEDGSLVNGFICESSGIEGATDITKHGGWRKWIAAGKPLD